MDPCKRAPCKIDPCKMDPCKIGPCKMDTCKIAPCKMDHCEIAHLPKCFFARNPLQKCALQEVSLQSVPVPFS